MVRAEKSAAARGAASRLQRAGHKHDAAAAEFTGLGELGGEASGVQDGCILISAVLSDPVGKEAVSVGDVKEEAHGIGLDRDPPGFQVTKL
ncbi:hypothetical protein RAD10_36395 [Bradyrhizobium sp. 23AC]